ncbi:BON domain-containing protein [Pseudomonas sp. D8002]|uniref:BON domain-containing protein n=3 Tax=Pseudomonas TaxID=286 RepID=UPI000B3F849F|nr:MULTISPECIES: BON domain-containing protein [unclassified Pseudomonas]NVZ13938.1 BON domain-containing protein [Pseudomonas sp. IPO3775]NVZ34230.1 BON domain-containing protein [Pseudomonas sp. A4002]NVZ37463.1 BON domain-containing protein [Pseudomonas sp. 21615526]NWA78880.1 BON domain-containing protein [Pseudomonas sp. C8002]NWA87082.1 BON domain-containing protein [Pseudomonas sp. D8002]
MTVKRLSLLAITLCLGISGCSSVIEASRDTPIQDDKGTRTFGSKIDDSLIETKVSVNVSKAAPDLGNGASRIVVVSFNGVVLLTGQTPRADLKAQAEQAAATVQRVKKVHNELQVMEPITLLAISNDALLTTKIKTQMLTDSAIPGSRIKIVTDNGIVYMMGLLTQAEATRAANLVQSVSGVQKIVKLFEYID